MNYFHFIKNNLNILEEIYFSAEDGIVAVPASEFDFSSPDLKVDSFDDSIVFSVPIGMFTLTCSVDSGELAGAVQHMQAISSPSVRESVIKTIEENLHPSAEERYNDASTEAQIAAEMANDAKHDFDAVTDSLRGLKGFWSIP